MNHTVESFIEKHNLIKESDTVVVGVSGGPDSMALLHFLNEHKKIWKLNILAVSIDHQLRGQQSKDDSEYVRDICKEWEIPFQLINVDVEKYKKKKGLSTQVASREARYDAFKNVLLDEGSSLLALGHHADDQIETMLMALTKVTRPEILSGIPLKRKFHNSTIVRPLLCVSKEQIEAYCLEHQIDVRYDASNANLDYERNYFREVIVPPLKVKNNNLAKTMQVMSESLQEDMDYLKEQAIKAFKDVVQCHDVLKKVTVDIPLMTKEVLPLQRRIYQLVLDYLYEERPDSLSYVHERFFLDLLKEGNQNKTINFPDNMIMERSYEHIHFYFDCNKDAHAEVTLSVPCEQGDFRTSYVDEIEGVDEEVFYCEDDAVVLPLKIRRRLPGDRIRWHGLGGSKKVKDVFIDKKIPRQKRDEIIVLTDSLDEVLWLVGITKGYAKASKGQGRYIKVEYIGPVDFKEEPYEK